MESSMEIVLSNRELMSHILTQFFGAPGQVLYVPGLQTLERRDA